MSNSGINKNLDNVISTLNKKADVNLANSSKASEIESIANSAASAAQSAATVAHAASELINTALPQKVNKLGDTINGNLIVDGNMIVTGEINATIKGSSESAMSATKDSNGNVIVDTYATKNDIIGVVRSVNGTNADAAGNVAITIPTNPKAYVTKTYRSGKKWYRIWNDGTIEQGGSAQTSKAVTAVTVTLPTAFSSTNYTTIISDASNASGNGDYFNSICAYSLTTSNFKIKSGYGGTHTWYWYAIGY